MKDKIEFKACPFCGSEDIRILRHRCKYNKHDEETGEWVPIETDTYTADCFGCGCATDCFNTPGQAAKVWNRRV